MEEIVIASLLEVADISEWVDWMKRMLPLGGVELPNDETSVFFAANSLRFADRIRPMCYHLPGKLKSLLVEAGILHQCWSRQRKLREKVKAGAAYRNRGLQMVVAAHHICRMKDEGQSHLMEADDGFRYVVKFSNPQVKMGLATEMICSELAGLMGLPVPPAVAFSVDGKLVKQVNGMQIEPFCGTVPCARELCFGSRYVESNNRTTVPGRITNEFPCGSRGFRQFVGAMVFHIWTLDVAPQQVVIPFNQETGRFEATFVDQSHCLMGGDWDKFLKSPYTEPVAPRWIAGRVTTWAQLEPWIRRAEGVDMDRIWELAFQLPPKWYGENRSFLARVVEKLEGRRWSLRRSIHHLIQIGYFPRFKTREPRSPSVSQIEHRAIPVQSSACAIGGRKSPRANIQCRTS